MIVFMLVYIAIAFSIGFFTEEVFPFSPFPMYANNSLTPCGYLVFDNENKILPMTDRRHHLFLKYAREKIGKRAGTCQTVREEFLPIEHAKTAFSVKKYCVDLTKSLPVAFEKKTILNCQSVK